MPEESSGLPAWQPATAARSCLGRAGDDHGNRFPANGLAPGPPEAWDLLAKAGW
jgi:hypothetical protein